VAKQARRRPPTHFGQRRLPGSTNGLSGSQNRWIEAKIAALWKDEQLHVLRQPAPPPPPPWSEQRERSSAYRTFAKHRPTAASAIGRYGGDLEIDSDRTPR